MSTQTHERCTAIQLRLSSQTLAQVELPISMTNVVLLQDLSNILSVIEGCTAEVEIAIHGHRIGSAPVQSLMDLCSRIRFRQGGSGYVAVAADASGSGIVLTVGRVEQTWRNA